MNANPPLGYFAIWKQRHRMFPQIYTLNIAIACVAAAMCRVALPDEPHGELKSASLRCRQFDREVHFPIVNVMETIIADATTFGIDIAITANTKPIGVPSVKTRSLNPILAHIIAPLFTDFFENHRPWLDTQLSENPYEWPEVWNFSRVVRNAASHGGRINWRNQKSPAVTWRHLSYSAADRNKTVICGDLDVADLILLMLDMNDELDKLGCPIFATS